MAISPSLVFLSLFQDLQRQSALVSHGVLKQVQHDDIIPETVNA
jgi:hypothetical protein